MLILYSQNPKLASLLENGRTIRPQRDRMVRLTLREPQPSLSQCRCPQKRDKSNIVSPGLWTKFAKIPQADQSYWRQGLAEDTPSIIRAN